MIKKKQYKDICLNGVTYSVPEEIFYHIRELESGLKYEQNLNYDLKIQLDSIKPVIETKMLEPAVSNCCRYCQYAIKSSYNGDILGCCKNAVCKEFTWTRE